MSTKDKPEGVTDDMLAVACKVFSESSVVYPDRSVKVPISDWFDLDAQDAADFGVLKEPKWHVYSDIRGMEHEWYVAAVVKDPIRAALEAALPLSGARVKDWLGVAKAAGEHGIRYRTNRALERFLADISPFLASQASQPYAEAVAPYAAAIRMIGDGIEQIFGPLASLESEEATLLRGPEPHHRAEGILEALQRVAARLAPAESVEMKRYSLHQTPATGRHFMLEHSDGDWVKCTDAQAALAAKDKELDIAWKEVVALRTNGGDSNEA